MKYNEGDRVRLRLIEPGTMRKGFDGLTGTIGRRAGRLQPSDPRYAIEMPSGATILVEEREIEQEAT
jgi:hypothetical protein